MQDVASSLGLSRATVSYALSDDWESKGVAPATQERVLAKAREMGYRRNPVATALKTKVSLHIGILIGEMGKGSSVEVLRGIESVLGRTYSIVLGQSDGSAEKERMHLERFAHQMVDGLIVIQLVEPEHAPLIRDLQERGTPVIETGMGSVRGTMETVEVDNVGAGRTLTEHLISLGYQRVAYLRGPCTTSFARHREEGYLETMARHGLATMLLPKDAEVRSAVASAVEATEALCRDLAAPFGLVTDDSMAALGVLKVLGDHGLRCPEDVSVCACGNRPLSVELVRDLFGRNLTRVMWPAEEVGAYAAQRLLARLKGEGVDNGPRGPQPVPGPLEMVPARWVAGDTTARARSD